MFPEYKYRDAPLYIKLNQKAVDYHAQFHKQFEIAFVNTGNLTVTIDAAAYRLHPGDLYVIFPNLIHTGVSGEDAELSLMIVNCESFPAFSDTLLHYKPSNPVLTKGSFDPIVYSIFNRIRNVSVSDQVYRQSTLNGYLNSVLGEIFPHLTLVRREPGNSIIQQLILYFQDHYTEDITLDQVARALNYSKYYVSHVIGETFKCNFRSLINSYRVGMAQNLLLSTNKSVGEITFECGFNNQSSFNRVFLKHNGITPSAYRRQQDLPVDTNALFLR